MATSGTDHGLDRGICSLAYALIGEMRATLDVDHLATRAGELIEKALGIGPCVVTLGADSVAGALGRERPGAAGGFGAATGAGAPAGAGADVPAGAVSIPIGTSDRTLGYLLAAPPTEGKMPRGDLARIKQAAALLTGPLEMALAVEAMRDAVTSDELTGLYNHRLFGRKLREEIYRSQRHGRSFSLCLIDVNDLNGFNEVAGWEAGNEVLTTLASTLSNGLRASDFVARLRGDEFGVIMAETGKNGATACMRRTAATFAEGCLLVRNQVFVVPTISFGVASCPGDGKDAAQLTEVAERRMRQRRIRVVRRTGDGRVIVLGPPSA